MWCIGLQSAAHSPRQDLDGRAELLLGTFDGSLLVYRAAGEGYTLACRFEAGAPIYAIHVAEIGGEGVRDIVVVAADGYHIVQV